MVSVADNLTVKQLDWLDQLLLQPLDTVHAWELALEVRRLRRAPGSHHGRGVPAPWVGEAKDSELEPLIKFAEMLEAHWAGVLRLHKTRVSNGLLEGLNSLIQAAKRRAAGTARPATTRR